MIYFNLTHLKSLSLEKICKFREKQEIILKNCIVEFSFSENPNSIFYFALHLYK